MKLHDAATQTRSTSPGATPAKPPPSPRPLLPLAAAARDALGPAKIVAAIERRRGEVALYLIGAGDGGPLRIGTTRNLAEPVAQLQKYNHAEMALQVVVWLAGPEAAALLKALTLDEARRRRVVIRDSWLNLAATAAERMVLSLARDHRLGFMTDAERADAIRRQVEKELGL